MCKIGIRECIYCRVLDLDGLEIKPTRLEASVKDGRLPKCVSTVLAPWRLIQVPVPMLKLNQIKIYISIQSLYQTTTLQPRYYLLFSS